MPDIVNMVGFNFRMTEIEAAIARCQLKKLGGLLGKRQENCEYLNEKLSRIPGITPPKTRPGCSHSYYVHPLKFDSEIIGVSREKFIDAVKKELPPTEHREGEGVLIGTGYCKPLYLQPIFQKLIAYGDKGCPFTCRFYQGNVSFKKGICPVTERLYEKELFTHDLMLPPMTKEDLNDVAHSFEKVYGLREEI